MIHYTYEDVLLSLKEIVHAKGEDYIYPRAREGCVYFESDGQPSCLIGHFMYEQGLVTHDDAHNYEDSNAEHAAAAMEANEIASFDERAIVLMQEAQENQDWGRPWGASLASAVDKVARKFGV